MPQGERECLRKSYKKQINNRIIFFFQCDISKKTNNKPIKRAKHLTIGHDFVKIRDY